MIFLNLKNKIFYFQYKFIRIIKSITIFLPLWMQVEHACAENAQILSEQ